ncbi:MAG: hypothetical protein GTN62_10355 [Gemmatimonadales bacterium]|nr:hypothetical protein [Gemmatimonadales bacterium]NIN11962.1 hypothetical protein [Gemmatimonadales bacterium]NIN50497.1 hypothetical protein [Gemmatimonadales bacterium]NIP07961.1 hypothetical protein [Gemmatimonadales bacterium]NIR01983.1 hypothetical protein [Gemmatimonadales bacterium]
MSRLHVLLLSVGACAALTSLTEAQQPQRGKPKQQAVAGFTAVERETIANFFAKNPIEVKPLPPGIAKNLARGKPLPPGLAKRQLPQELVEQLPARKEEGVVLEVTIFGDRIVLLEASGLVVDILEGIFK